MTLPPLIVVVTRRHDRLRELAGQVTYCETEEGAARVAKEANEHNIGEWVVHDVIVADNPRRLS